MFTRAEISGIARSSGTFLIEELKNDLNKSSYSLSLDKGFLQNEKVRIG